MKGRKPFSTRMKVAFASVAAVFGLGITTGGLESIPKDPMTDTQVVTTFNKGTADAYGYNIAPSDQFWKATLGMKTQDGLSLDALNAADNGDTWRTKTLLDNGLSIYSPGAHDAFAKAAHRGHEDVFNAYLKAGIDPGANDGKALVEALRGNNSKLAYVLIEKGVSGASQGSEGLGYAAIRGDTDMIAALLKAGADPKANDSAALKYAAFMGNVNAVAALLDAGADVSANDHTAVRQAAEAGHLEVLKMLIAKGGDVSAGDGAALVAAATYSTPEMVKFILDQKKTYNVNVSDYESGFLGEYMSTFSTSAVSPNVAGGSALIAAVEAGNVENARVLLNAGAIASIGDGAALTSAIFNNNYSMVELLLANGANVNAGDGAALHMAVTMDNAFMAQLLMSNGAKADLKSGDIMKIGEASKNAEIRDIVKGKKFDHLQPHFGI